MKNPLAMRIALKYAATFEAPPKFLKDIQTFMTQKYAGHILARTNKRIEALQDGLRANENLYRAEDLKSHLRYLTKSKNFYRDWVMKNSAFDDEHFEPQHMFLKLYPSGEGVSITAYAHPTSRSGMYLTYQITDARQNPQGKVYGKKGDTHTALQIEELVKSAALKVQEELSLTEANATPSTALVDLIQLKKHVTRYTNEEKEYKTKVHYKTKVNLSGWKYTRGIPKAQEKLDSAWGPLDVSLHFKEHVNRRGYWHWQQLKLEVDMPRDALTTQQFDANLAEMLQIARHEAQHVGQDALRVIKDLNEDAGLPKNRTQGYTPSGLRVDAPRGQRLDHALQDIEFHTRLQDEIDEAVYLLKNIQRQDRRSVLHGWVGNNITHMPKYQPDLLEPKEFFLKLKKSSRAKWKEAVKDYISEVSKRIAL